MKIITGDKPSIFNQTDAEHKAIEYMHTIESTAASSIYDGYKIACKLRELGLDKWKCSELMEFYWQCEPPLDANESSMCIHSAYQFDEKEEEKDCELFDKALMEVGERVQNLVKKEELNITLVEGLSFENFKYKQPTPQLIDNLLGNEAISSLVGIPNCGKTFIALDMALSIARGIEFLGRKTIKGASLYFPLEGLGGFKKRIEAYKNHTQTYDQSLPFWACTESINLAETSSIDTVLKAVKTTEALFNEKLRFMVFDTLNMLMAGFDENSSTDMTKVINTLKQIRNEADCHIMIVHHLGKNAEKGARGSSVLIGAVDTEIRVTQNMLKIGKQRDMDKTENLGFNLQNVEIGTDTVGNVVSSCVIEPVDLEIEKAFGNDEAAGKNAAMLYKLIVEEALSQDKINLLIIKAKYSEIGKSYGSKQAKYNSFKRAVDSLTYRGAIEVVENTIFVVNSKV